MKPFPIAYKRQPTVCQQLSKKTPKLRISGQKTVMFQDNAIRQGGCKNIGTTSPSAYRQNPCVLIFLLSQRAHSITTRVELKIIQAYNNSIRCFPVNHPKQQPLTSAKLQSSTYFNRNIRICFDISGKCAIFAITNKTSELWVNTTGIYDSTGRPSACSETRPTLACWKDL